MERWEGFSHGIRNRGAETGGPHLQAGDTLRSLRESHGCLYSHSSHFLKGCSGGQGSRDICTQVDTLGLRRSLLVAWKLARAV